MLYAAYGSTMDPAQMLRRCPASPHTGTGWIRGWRLTSGAEDFGWEGALATLVPDDDPRDPGLPSARHLGALADAAQAAGAPDDYVLDLRSRECRSTGV